MTMSDRSLAYTLDAYGGFLEGLLDDGYRFHGFESLSEQAVVVRHDVDLSPTHALRMARTEADLGVETTYCFMLTTPAYDLPRHVETIDEIRSLGHDVALHFDPHHYWEERPGTETLESVVARECDLLERLLETPIDTVSFHMPPDWVLERTFDGFLNTYQPRFFGEIDYISDSQQKWRTAAPFRTGRPEQLQILIHPGVWTPENRRMDDIIQELAESRIERIDRYVEAF